MSEYMLPLAEVVQALRNELVTAASAAQNESIHFQVGPIDLEFTVVAKREGGPEGKIKFEVFGFGAEIGGKVTVASEQTQKVKLTLTPVQIQKDQSRVQLEINKNPGQGRDDTLDEPLVRRPDPGS